VDPPAEQHEPLPGHPVRVNPSPAPVHIPTPHARWLIAAVTVAVAVVVVLGVVLLPNTSLPGTSMAGQERGPTAATSVVTGRSVFAVLTPSSTDVVQLLTVPSGAAG
jgi:hypothetical protein